jgi:hypothetical protein
MTLSAASIGDLLERTPGLPTKFPAIDSQLAVIGNSLEPLLRRQLAEVTPARNLLVGIVLFEKNILPGLVDVPCPRVAMVVEPEL